MENSAQESVAARREALARRQQAARSALRAPDAEAAPEAAPAPAGASEGGRDRTEAEPPPTAQDSAPSAPPCSGVVAVRRFTDLCDRAQAADKRGETATALSLYRELLQLRERLQSGRGPLLQTLFAVAQKVERRVAELDGSTCSSAPTTGRSSSHSQEMVVIRPPTTAESLSRPASAAAVVQPPRALTSGPRDTAAPSRRASEAQPPHESQWAVQQQPPATRTSTPESEVEHVMRSSWPASGKAPARSTPNLGANSSHGQGETSSDDERPAPPKPSFGRHGPMPPGPTTRARPADVRVRTVRPGPQSARSAM